jgi:hypothetical protein
MDSIPDKIKKLQRLEKTVVRAHPISGVVGSVSLTVKNLDISNPSVYPTKSLAEVVKFQIGMLDLDTETILEETDLIINGYSARKIVYISRFRSLIDKDLVGGK